MKWRNTIYVIFGILIMGLLVTGQDNRRMLDNKEVIIKSIDYTTEKQLNDDISKLEQELLQYKDKRNEEYESCINTCESWCSHSIEENIFAYEDQIKNLEKYK